MRLDGKQVIIIGGSSGIGLETARLALAEGASVLIAGRSEERLRKAAAALNSEKLRTAVADISGETSIQAMFAAEKQIDHVFLPAGELRPGGGDVLATDMRDLESLLKLRLLGVVNVVRQVRSKMTSGSITLMSGLYSTRPGKGGAMSAAGVAAIEGMTRALASERRGTRPDRHPTVGYVRAASGSDHGDGHLPAGGAHRKAGGRRLRSPVPDEK
jgi:NAD(P)-dependent dehydrogenase (short-subunit alcohol dehydrogenase family)